MKKVKDLKEKKQNILYVNNLSEFRSMYQNNSERYKPFFKILAELEEKVLNQEIPEKTILIDYKDEGSIVFDLDSVVTICNNRYLFYEYSTMVS
jgi:hypothetical protein